MSRLLELNKILHKLRTYTYYHSPEEVNKDIDRAIELAEYELAPEEISPCENCYCMTHTIKGKCGKCGAKKDDKKAPSEVEEGDSDGD